ncbi:hypothetical protein [Roseomonas harenae]|uniref:hypothetical protein n=1 Tax=Muricoccus harenae TaxID=2692566 RepID=UPI001331A515|nr:hypothetical protein [Roseomonas harenae]
MSKGNPAVVAFLKELIAVTDEAYKDRGTGALADYERYGSLSPKRIAWAKQNAKIKKVTVPAEFDSVPVFDNQVYSVPVSSTPALPPPTVMPSAQQAAKLLDITTAIRNGRISVNAQQVQQDTLAIEAAALFSNLSTTYAALAALFERNA